MDDAAVRIQVPAGAAFHGVLGEAAAKVAWRANFSDDAIGSLNDLVALAAEIVSSAEPSQQRLEIEVQQRRVAFVVTGDAPTRAISADAARRLRDAVASLDASAQAEIDGCAIAGWLDNTAH